MSASPHTFRKRSEKVFQNAIFKNCNLQKPPKLKVVIPKEKNVKALIGKVTMHYKGLNAHATRFCYELVNSES